MDGRTDGQTDGRADGQTDGQTKERTDGDARRGRFFQISGGARCTCPGSADSKKYVDF